MGSTGRTSVWISGGVIGYELGLSNYSFAGNKRYAVHNIPGANKNVYQNMGSDGKKLNVNGFTFSRIIRGQLEGWESSGTLMVMSGTNFYLSGGVIQGFKYSEDASPDTFPITFGFTLTEV